MGARSNDVFKIFFSESFVIGLICVALSTAASIFLCRLLNGSFAAELGASIFVFGPLSFGVLAAYTALCALPLILNWKEDRKWNALRSKI